MHIILFIWISMRKTCTAFHTAVLGFSFVCLSFLASSCLISPFDNVSQDPRHSATRFFLMNPELGSLGHSLQRPTPSSAFSSPDIKSASRHTESSRSSFASIDLTGPETPIRPTGHCAYDAHLPFLVQPRSPLSRHTPHSATPIPFALLVLHLSHPLSARHPPRSRTRLPAHLARPCYTL